MPGLFCHTGKEGLDMETNLIAIRRDLHRIPELGYKEHKTQRYILDFISRLPKGHLEVKTWKTGVLVKVKGTCPEKKIGYRTDIDGLPIKEETGFPFQSEHEGNMHACGHDFHMTIALGILSHFASRPVKDDLIFIFQPAEEGPGGAKAMLEEVLHDEWQPDLVMALHVAPEYPAGTVAVKKGLLFANTSELYIDLEGKGGHAAYPQHTKDMVVAAAHLVTQLQSIISRNIDPLDSAVVTIGKITGGTVQNAIAEHARLEGTIRTLSSEAMEKVKHRIETLTNGLSVGFECRAEIDYGCNYYQVFNHPEETARFMDFVRSYGGVHLHECREALTGEDFGYMLKEIPGFMFWLGVGSPYGLHHAKFAPDERALETAADLMIAYILSLQ
ncbi:N-acetyl-L,L-diaminopimelate deacetylase [Heyndrickxia coagulans]|uniref:N-acetyldiaminopimelate deacetylase n=2 Tax=Heyndrickxia TaxID=2837504 RepID=A0AAN0T8I1_HEYCO|nr:N-acetyldiaminopimelate deacetylase [Heyndrickxia coagulans]AKN54933.1 N-acetyl-L,L-diaminopimelate deacetylase [Heyndrickxia coagulans]